MSQQYCGFISNDRLYGLPISEVQELLKPQVLTPVPLARPEILGLINLRGQVVPAIDLRAALGHPLRAPGQSFMNVVTRTAHGPVALTVDSVADVVTVEANQLEPVPDTVAKSQRQFLLGACKLPERLLLILNLEHLTRVGDRR